jgi:hypothetical protein
VSVQTGAGEIRSGADDNVIAPNDAANDAPLDPATKAVEAAQSDALNAVARTIGNEKANALLDHVAETGELEVATQHGVSPAQVDAVVKGYVAQADAMLADVGVNGSILSEVLRSDELAAARASVINGDGVMLRSLGEKAVHTLTSLDRSNPQAFEAMLDARDVMYERAENGSYKVAVEGSDNMVPWAAAVRMGALRHLK